MTSLSFAVSGVPDSLNRWMRKHWAVRDKQRREWAETLGKILLAKGCRKSRPMFLNEVSVTLHYRVAHNQNEKRPDLDNLVPKQIIDGMMGYAFEDDSAVRLLIQSIEYDADREETIICVKPLED